MLSKLSYAWVCIPTHTHRPSIHSVKTRTRAVILHSHSRGDYSKVRVLTLWIELLGTYSCRGVLTGEDYSRRTIATFPMREIWLAKFNCEVKTSRTPVARRELYQEYINSQRLNNFWNSDICPLPSLLNCVAFVQNTYCFKQNSWRFQIRWMKVITVIRTSV